MPKANVQKGDRSNYIPRGVAICVFRNWYQSYRNLQECTFSSTMPHLHRRVVSRAFDKHLVINLNLLHVLSQTQKANIVNQSRDNI
eukprot:scaffold7444_cov90-Skeletonema_dohrnii-CCMP3373.AAC.2